MRPLRSTLFQFALLTSVLTLAATTANAQTTYRWVDPGGKTVFSDQPPPAGAKAIATREGKPPSDDKAIPYAVRIAAEKYPVTLYTAANCTEACADARGLLNGRGIPFSEKMVKNKEEAAELLKDQRNAAKFPTLKVGQQSFVGFESGAWNNLLDLAGYPKSAPYGAKPSGAFAR
ncbi:glutaredoxin family protein [Propionivibrio limicola]|uniref:glutaredoxin family protein n=1 Tax=Propionivibrio limicola TaxID=167645 RepID=UPI0012923257|nr:glutaredoxin family protein [Propionivibrio limicola]